MSGWRSDAAALVVRVDAAVAVNVAKCRVRARVRLLGMVTKGPAMARNIEDVGGPALEQPREMLRNHIAVSRNVGFMLVAVQGFIEQTRPLFPTNYRLEPEWLWRNP